MYKRQLLEDNVFYRGRHSLLSVRCGDFNVFRGNRFDNPDQKSAEIYDCEGVSDAPYELDARLCISYLTIELKGSIPEPLRPLIGNRIYGCDDCQLVCPWNRFATPTAEPDFLPRHGLDSTTLIELFAWDEPEFLRRTEGSAIRRIGHPAWLRNIAVALGNASDSAAAVEALNARLGDPSDLVREHVAWALSRHS